jgi:predicted metal-dependent hydrolase
MVTRTDTIFSFQKKQGGELCHLKIMEHSHHYWDYVRLYIPNYQEKIEWLKISGSHLI